MMHRQNWVLRLKDHNGDWCEDQGQLQRMAKQFYEELYTKEACLTPSTKDWVFPALNGGNWSWLNRVVSGEEVRRAMS